MVVDKKVPAYDLVLAITKSTKILKSASIFDVYEGEHVGENKKSIAISLLFEDPSRTLDDQTINKAIENILERIAKEFNAKLRQ